MIFQFQAGVRNATKSANVDFVSWNLSFGKICKFAQNLEKLNVVLDNN